MVKPRRGVLFLVAGGLLVAAWLMMRPAPAAPTSRGTTPARRGRSQAVADEIPRIDLARIDSLAKLERIEAPVRSLSEFQRDPAPPPPPPMPETTPIPVAAPVGTPPPPPLNMTYLGNLENQKGLKVAVFLTDKKIVLHGREGEIVGSRVRVVKIGLESVDVEDLNSGRSQRMALPRKGGGEAARDARDRDKDPGGNSR